MIAETTKEMRKTKKTTKVSKKFMLMNKAKQMCTSIFENMLYVFIKKNNIYIQIHDVVETVEYMLFTKWHSKPKGEIEKENHLMSKQN